MVSREGAARYRIRGYVAAHVHHGRTTIAWIWDVYDADQNRALRISGEEDAGRAGKDAWADTDDDVLRRMSRTGMDRLVSFLATPSQEASVEAAPKRVLAVAGTGDDFSPESAGIFRSAGATDDAQGEPEDGPSPKRPPAQAGSAPTRTIACRALIARAADAAAGDNEKASIASGMSSLISPPAQAWFNQIRQRFR